jgi:hypothetical protein
MSSDPKRGTPPPGGNTPKPAKPAPPPPPADDESVDFRHHPASEEDVPALTGGKSGSSILTWDELVRQQNADDQVEIGASESSVDFDSASDHDILREVLSGEKPPSKVIPRTKSHPELKVDTNVGDAGPPTKPTTPTPAPAPDTLKTNPPGVPAPPAPTQFASARYPRATPVEDDDDASFHITTDSEPEGSSILGSLGIEAGSEMSSGEMASGSRVDLLAHLRPKAGASGSLGPPIVAKPRQPDDEAQYGDEYAEGDDSSAVDLGSREVVDMPYPLGVDSSVGSSVVPGWSPGAPSSSRRGDSASVDLLGSSNDFGVVRQPGMSSVVEQLRGDSGHNLPPTVPMSPISRDRLMAWVGGSAVGLAASGLVFALLYSTGLVRFGSEEFGKPIQAVAKAPAGQNPQQGVEIAAMNDRLTDMQKRHAAELAAAKDQAATDSRSKIAKATQDAKAEREKLVVETQQLRDQLEEANAEKTKSQTELAATIKRSDQARAADQKALKDAEDRLAKLTSTQDNQSSTVAKAAEEQVRAREAEAEAAKKALADFQHALNLKLVDANLIAGNAKPADLLAGVDKALQRRPGVTSGSFDSLQAERLFSTGMRAYRDRDFALAEQTLNNAAKANDRDGRIRYLLGLARYQLGRPNDAQADFYAAAALERQYQPSPHEVDEFLARLPGADRTVVGQYRP